MPAKPRWFRGSRFHIRPTFLDVIAGGEGTPVIASSMVPVSNAMATISPIFRKLRLTLTPGLSDVAAILYFYFLK
jgi:hypothetical protein